MLSHLPITADRPLQEGRSAAFETGASGNQPAAGPLPSQNNHDSRITIVSGLPRSGTSLMMQMLAAGGMNLLTDARRAADSANPAGYFELEAVKQTRFNAGWTTEASGKAVKVIYRLLYDLPPALQYRVIFMRRNLQQVTASQRAMLGLPPAAAADRQRLIDIFTGELAHIDAWLAAHGRFQVLHVEHAHLLADPAAACEAVAEFLDRPLKISAMCAAIKPALYRQKCR